MKSFYCGLHRALIVVMISILGLASLDISAQTFKLPKEFSVAQADSAMLDSLLINNSKNYGLVPPGWTAPLNTAKVCGAIIALEADPKINGVPINQDDVIGAFFVNDDGDLQCGGLSYWPDTAGIVMSVFGDDPDTPEKDGFSHGEAITYKLFSWEHMGQYDVDEIELETGSGLLGVNKWYQLGLIRLIEISCFEDLWVSVSVDQELLCVEGTVSFTVEVVEGSGNITYNWTSDPPGFTSTLQNPDFFVTEPTLFFVEAFDGVNQSLNARPISVSFDAVVEAGENIATCGVEMLELNGTTAYATSSEWTTSGDGTFADPLAPATSYFPGTNDLINTSFTLTLTGTPETPCTQTVSDDLIVEIYPTPIINIPESFSTCQTSPVYLSAEGYNLSEIEWSTEGNGFFVYGNTLSPIYIPGSYANSHSDVAITCTGQGIDPCNFMVEEYTEIIINKNAFCAAGADATICGDNSYELCGAAAFENTVVWSTDGDGTFTDISELKPFYTPGQADIDNGVVELTLTVTSLPPCAGSQSDKVELFLNPPPTIDAGNDIPAFGNPDVEIAATGSDYPSVSWITTGDGSFEDIYALSTIYHAGAADIQAGMVELIIQADPIDPCTQPATDNVMIIFEGGATADAGPDQTSCSGQQVSLQGTATNYESIMWSTAGDGTFNNPEELSTQYFPGTDDIATGEVIITLTPYGESPNGAGLSDDMILTVIPPASVTVSENSINLCANEEVMLSANPENYGSILWETSGDGYFDNPNTQNTRYFPGSNDLATGEISVSVTVTSVSPCQGNAIENIEIELFNAPFANAGYNGEVCEGQAFEINGTATSYSSVSWSTSGDGIFDNPALLQTEYTTGTQDIQQGGVFLTLTAQPISPCQVADSDQLYLSIANEPTSNAGNDVVICEGDQIGLSGTAQNFDYCLWTTDGDGSFGNTSSLNTDYFPGDSDIQNQTVTLTLMAYPEEPCQVVATDELMVTIQDAPNVYAGSDLTICETEQVILSGLGQGFQSVQWNSSGDGTFENPLQLNTTYTPGANDISGQQVNICLDATGTALCGNTSSCITVTIVNTPAVFAGNDNTAPVGIPFTTQDATAENYESISWSTDGNGTFDNPELIVTNYTPALEDLNSGTVTLTLTAEPETPCQINNADEIALIINSGCSNATVSAGPDIMRCVDGNPVILDEASAQNQESLLWTTTGDGYFSDNTSLNTEYFPGPDDTENGTVELCISAYAYGICEDATDCLTVELLPPPTVNIQQSELSICDTETISLSANTGNAEALSWSSNGDGTFSDEQILNPVYYPGEADILSGNVQLCLAVTGHADCETATDCIDVTIVEAPAANAGTDQTICESTGAAMNGLVQNSTSFYWETTGDGTFFNEGTLFAVYNPGPGDVSAGEAQICLTANGNNPCGAATDCINLTIVKDPYVNAGDDKTVCNNTVAQLSGYGENYDNLTWSTSGDGAFNDFNATSTIYSPGPSDQQYGQVEICLTATGLYNCNDFADCIILTINPVPEITICDDMIVCEGEQAQLYASASNYETVTWTTKGDGAFDNQNQPEATYSPGPNDIANGGAELCLTATGLDACDNTTECMSISIVQNPEVIVGDDFSVCEGDEIQLTASASNYTSLQWQSAGSGTFSQPNQLTTIYHPCATDIVNGYADICLTAEGAEGCGTDEACLTVYIQKLPGVFIGDDLTICADETVDLQATVTFASGHFWTSSGNGSFTDPQALNTTYTPSPDDIQNGTANLCLTGFGINGCSNTETCMSVTIEPLPTAEAGANATICENQVAVLSGVAENHSSILWQTSGDGTFDNDNLLNTVYVPGTNDKESGEVVITLEAAGQQYCPGTSDSMILSINKLPSAFAGNDLTMIQQGTFQTSQAEAEYFDLIMWQTSGDGTFENPELLNTMFYPDASDYQTGYAVLELHASPLEPCTIEAIDEMTLFFELPCMDAIAYAGEDNAICSGSNYQMNGSTTNATALLWTTQGDGSFENPNLENTWYYPGPSDNESGQVIICMEAFANGNCLNGNDCMTLTINKPPIVFAGSDNTIPKYESYYLSEAYAENYQILQWFTTNGTGTFDNSNIENPTYTPGTIDWIIGNISLSFTASPLNPCMVSETSSLNLAFTDGCANAIVDAGENIILCEGETLTEVILNNAYATNFKTISWNTNGDGYFSNNNVLQPVYTLGPQDIQNGGAELTLIAEGWEGCNGDSDLLIIETLPAPIANAGNDQTICGDNGTMLSGSAANYNTVQWITSGDGIFDVPASLNPMYFPGNEDMANGTVQLCLIAYSEGNCPDDEDCMTLNLIPNATADAGDDASVCRDNSYQLNGDATGFETLLWSTSGDGTFSDPSNLSAVYTPGINDLNSGSVTLSLTAFGIGQCADITSDMNLEIIDNPVAFAGDNATIVAGQSYTLQNAYVINEHSVLWESSGDGTFNDQTLIQPDYYPGNNDITTQGATLTITAIPEEPCTVSDSDEIFLTIEADCEDAIADAGSDITTCGPSGTPLSGTAQNQISELWQTLGDGTFDNPASLTAIYYPGTEDLINGTAELCLTAFAEGDCNDDTDCLTISLFEGPTVNAGADINTCDDESFANLNGFAENYSTIQWSTSGTGYFWPESSLTPKYFFTSVDKQLGVLELVLTVSNEQCPPVTDTLLLSIGTSPIAYAGEDDNICGNEAYYAMDAFAADYEGLLWESDGDGTFDDETLLSTTYHPGPTDIQQGTVQLCLTATGSEGCDDNTHCLTLTLNPSAFADAGDDIIICETENAQLNGSAADFEYVTWTTSGDGTFDDDSSLTTIYTPGTADITAGQASLLLTAFSSTNCGNAQSETSVFIISTPTAYAGDDQAVCETDVAELNGNAENYSGILWSSAGDGTFDDETSLTAIYTPGTQDLAAGSVELCLTAMADGSCQDAQDCMMVSFEAQPTAFAGDDQVICETASVTLNGTAANYSAVLWETTGDGTFDNINGLNTTYTPGSADINNGTVEITLNAMAQSLCSDASDMLVINIDRNPVVDAGTDQAVCEAENIQMNATGAHYTGLLWSSAGDGTFDDETSLTAIYTPGTQDLAAGSVELCLTAMAGGSCGNMEDCLTVTFENMPTANAGQDQAICNGQNVNLSGSATNYNDISWVSSGDGYFSNPGILTPTYFPGNADKTSGSATLTLTVTSANSCPPAEDAMILTIEQPPQITAGTDQAICSTNEVPVAASGNNFASVIWTTNGDGTFAAPESLSTTYTPGINDVLSGNVSLCIMAFGNAACSDVTDCIDIEIEQEPQINAGGDVTICENDYYQLLPQVSGYSALMWSSNGDGTFDDATISNAIYTPGPEDINSGSTELCLAAEPVQLCSGNTDCFTLTILKQPFAFAGEDATIQSGIYSTNEAAATNYSELLWTTDGTGNFTNPNELNTFYIPGILDYQNGFATLTLEAVPNDPCNLSATDELILAIEPDSCLDAIAEAGDDATICATSGYQLDGVAYFSSGTLWTTSGDGTFDNPANADAVYFPGNADYAAGQANLCMEAFAEADCNSGYDCMTLFLQSPPAVFAGSDNTIPQYADYPLVEAYAENYEILQWYSTNGTGDFENSNTINTTYVPGTIDWLMGSIELCVTASPVSPCNVSVTDCFTLSFTNQCNDAEVFAGEDISLCEGEMLTHVSLENATAAYFTTLLWSTNGDGTFDYNNILNPTYTFGAQDIANGGAELTLEAEGWDNCSGASDVLVIQTIPAPQADAGTDMTVCGDAGVLLFATAENYNQIQWTTSGDGYFDNAGTMNPLYIPGTADMNTGQVQICITATGEGNCPDVVDCLELTLFPIPTANAGDDTQICAGNQYQLNGSASGFQSVLWTTTGDGTFDDATSLNAVYFPGIDDENTGNAALQLTAYGMGDCPDTTSEMAISIIENPVAFAGVDAEIEDDETYQVNDAYTQNAASVLWESSGDGNFNDATLTNTTYTPGNDDINNQWVTLTISAAPQNPCTVTASDEMLLAITESCENAIALAGDDITACDAVEVLLNGEASFQTGVLWETSGDGTFDDETMLNATYFPGNSDLTAGSTELCLTAYASNDCFDDTDCMMISYFDAPVANAGADMTLCDSESFVNLQGFAENQTTIHWSASGTGYFATNSNLTSKYFFTVPDKQSGELEIVLTASNDMCGQVSDTMTITLNPSPLAYAGADNTICGNEQYVIADAFAAAYAGITWSTSGDGTFDDTEILNATYFPGSADIQSGSADLCLTAIAMQSCENAADCFHLTINSSAYANAGENQTICESENAQLAGTATDYESVFWETQGDGTFDDNTLLSPLYTPGLADIAANQVNLQLTAISSTMCGDALSETTIFILNNPAVEAGSDQVICETEVVQLDGFTEYATGQTWTTDGDGTFDEINALTTSYTPGELDKTNGAVTLCLIAFADGTCQDAQDCITVSIETAPTADAGENQVICETEAVLLTGTASNYSTVLWETYGDGTFEDQTALSTTYYPAANDIAGGEVEITLNAVATSLCEDAEDALLITIDRNPVADAGDDLVICETGFAQLAGSTDFSTGQTWSTAGDGTFDNETALDAVYTPGELDKENGTVTLCLTAQAQGSCQNTDDCLTLTIEHAPVAFAGEDLIVCETATVPLSGTATNYSSVFWTSPGDGTFEDESELITTYYPGLTDINNGFAEITLHASAVLLCDEATNSLMVTFDQSPTVMAGDDLTICETETVVLNATSQNADQFLWTSSGDGTFADPAAPATIYTPGPDDILAGDLELCLSASGSDYCSSATDCINVTLQPVPNVILPEDFTICETENIDLTAQAANFGELIWQTDGDGSFETSGSLTNTYHPGNQDVENGYVTICLAATGISGCNNTSDCITIDIQQLPVITMGDDMIICENEIASLDATVENAASLLWSSTGDGTFSDPEAEAGTYTPGTNDLISGSVELCLTATGLNGCAEMQDCILIGFEAAPTANAGNDQTVCSGETIAVTGNAENNQGVLWETSGDGTFDNPEDLSTIYYPGPQDQATLSATLCLVAYGNEYCDSSSDCMTITLQPAPVSNAGDDITICEGQSVPLSGIASNYSSTYWTTSGDGNFSNPQLINPVYFPGLQDLQTGAVALCLKANGINGCSNVTDCLSVSIVGKSIVNAGDDISLCETESATLSGEAAFYSSLLWTSDGDGTFDDPASLTTDYVPGTTDIENGTVELCLNAQGVSPCESNSDCITLEIFESPLLISGDDILVCENQPIDLIMEAENYQSVFWQTNGDGTFDDEQSISTIYYPGTTDSISGGTEVCLTLFGLGSCDETVACLQITILDQPMAFAGNDDSVLHDEYFELSSAISSENTNVLWSTNGFGNFADVTLLNTTYYPDSKDTELDNVMLILNVEQTEPCSLSTADTLNLDVIPNATCFDVIVDAGNDLTICESSTIALTQASAYFEASLIWLSSGDGTFSDPALLHPTYTPGPADIVSGHTTLTLKGFANTPCIGASDEIALTIQHAPQAFAGSDNTIPDNLEAYYIADAYADYNSIVQWTRGNGTGDFIDDQVVNATYVPSFIDLMVGSVTLTMTVSPVGPCSASVSDQLVLTFSEGCTGAVADAGEDISLCASDTTFAVDGYAAAFTQCEWTTSGDGTFDHPNITQPNYTLGANDRIVGSLMLYLTVEPFPGCEGAVDSVKIEPLPMPVVDAGPDVTICENDLALLDQATVSNYTSVEWSTSGDGEFEDNMSLITKYTPGPDDISEQFVELTLTALSYQPCEVYISNAMTLEIDKLPELILDIEDVNAIVGDDVPLIIVSKYAESYQWYGPDGLIPGETLPVLMLLEVDFEDAGFYYCMLTNTCGTTTSNMAKVGVFENQIIDIPAGWSGLSGFIQPYNLDVEDIFAAYDDFVLIKNYGGIYYPGQNINALQLWNSQAGYEVNFTDEVSFELLGIENDNTVATIQQGWNYLPVISSCPVDIEAFFEGNESKIDIVKEIAGTGIYWPMLGLNTIGELIPGKAYNLRACEPFSVTFDPCTETKSSVISSIHRPENHTAWNDLHYTPSTHTIAIDPDWASQFEKGDVIGAFTQGGICAGYMELTSGQDALVLFGDDPLTIEADGFVDNEPVSLRLFSTKTGEDIEIYAEFDDSFPNHDGIFVSHGMSRLIKATPSGIYNQAALQAINLYPNPTFGNVTVTGLAAGSKVEVWNSEGQMLRGAVEVGDGMQGIIDFDLSDCAAGVVYIRIYNQNDVVIRKLVLK